MPSTWSLQRRQALNNHPCRHPVCAVGYEKEAGYVKYLELAKKAGLSLESVVKAANEIFPTGERSAGVCDLWAGRGGWGWDRFSCCCCCCC